MPITVAPLGVRCNLQCGYCYEDSQREAGNVGARYDVAEIKKAIRETSAEPEPFLLFGGEPLLLPKHILEDFWAWGFERSGRNSVQTNGSLIDQEHIALFKRYNVAVGISIDGPGALNDARWNHTLERTRASTKQTEEAISLLCAGGRPPSLIVTLHRLNATGRALDLLITWFRKLQALGVTRMGIHLLEVENDAMRAKYAMTVDESVRAVLHLRVVRSELPGINFSLLDDLDDLLMGDDAQARCIWRACDPYTTPAVRGIGGHGERTKCSRVNKEGIDFVPSDDHGYERYVALYQTPQEEGGCKGCRFFLMCRGQCPGTALDGDWRNRSEQCPTWMRIFESIEQELLRAGKAPFSLSSSRNKVEKTLIQLWESGRTAPIQWIARQVEQGESTIPGSSTSVSDLSGSTDTSFAKSTSIMPDRLSFELNGFSRLSWASTDARDIWSPQVERIRRTIRKAEWMSVAIGMRSAALLDLGEDSTDLFSELKGYGLSWTPINSDPHRLLRYLNSNCHLKLDGTTVIAVGRPPSVGDFIGAWSTGDHSTIATLLGYPKCCADFVEKVCGQDLFFDTIWAMAQSEVAESGHMAPNRELRVSGMPFTNVLLTSLGVRAVPHRPCSFHCAATDAFAKELRAVLTSTEDASTYRSLETILAWPAEWSALHGIAEVKSPIFKSCWPTDSTGSRYVVKWLGNDTYPREGASGVKFPYRKNSRNQGLTILNPNTM